MKSLDIKFRRHLPSGKGAGPAPLETKKDLPKKAGPVVRESAARPVRSRSPWQKTLLTIGVLAVFFLAALIYFVLPEARVTVTVRSEPTTQDFEIQVDKNQTEPDAATLKIPGTILEQEVSGSKQFTPTGKRDVGQSASGFVYIYNFSKTPLILKAQTTTLVANGQKYRFTQDVSGIRPTAMIGLENQEVDPTSLVPPVPVVAAGPGPQYNLAKGARLEIQNSVFGSQPKALYAIVAEDLSGGSTKEIKIVTAGDIVNAYTSLAGDLTKQAQQNLVVQNSNQKLLDKAVSTDTLEQKASVAAGTETSQFEVNLKMRLRGLVYSDADVRQVMGRRIQQLLPANQILQTTASTTIQSNFLTLNLDQGQGLLTTHFEGQVVYKVDAAELLDRIRGRSADEIREIMLSRPEIAAVEIRFYPFWVKTAPRFSQRVYLQVQTLQSSGK